MKLEKNMKDLKIAMMDVLDEVAHDYANFKDEFSGVARRFKIMANSYNQVLRKMNREGKSIELFNNNVIEYTKQREKEDWELVG